MAFNYKTASALAQGIYVSAEDVSAFVSEARNINTENEGLNRIIVDLNRLLLLREAEIEMLKISLLKMESE